MTKIRWFSTAAPDWEQPSVLGDCVASVDEWTGTDLVHPFVSTTGWTCIHLQLGMLPLTHSLRVSLALQKHTKQMNQILTTVCRFIEQEFPQLRGNPLTLLCNYVIIKLMRASPWMETCNEVFILFGTQNEILYSSFDVQLGTSR